MSKTIKIPGRIESAEMGGIVAGAGVIMDDLKNKRQSEVNAEVDDALAGLGEGKQDVLTFDNEPTENSNNPVKSGGVYAADLALSQAIEAILLLIPSAASALNKLADKAFVNSTEATNTATFRGTFNVVSGLGLAYNATHEQIAAALLTHIAMADNNDYAFVQIPVSGTSSDIAKTERYKFNGEAWGYEYDLNNSGYTQAQWDAINSTITLALVQKLSELPTAEALQQSFNAKQDNLTFDNTPTAGSTNPVTSGGVKTELNVLDVAVSAVQLALDALTGRVTTAEGNIATNTATIEVLQSIYVALTQSALVVVDTTDTWPVANPATETIYRVVDRTNTPPQYYSDYIWNGTTMVLLAQYNNAIDDEPTPISNNLVKSGGVVIAIDNKQDFSLHLEVKKGFRIDIWNQETYGQYMANAGTDVSELVYLFKDTSVIQPSEGFSPIRYIYYLNDGTISYSSTNNVPTNVHAVRLMFTAGVYSDYKGLSLIQNGGYAYKSDLQSDINGLVLSKTIAPEFKTGYVRKSDGSYIIDGTWSTSDYIKVQEGETIAFNAGISSGIYVYSLYTDRGLAYLDTIHSAEGNGVNNLYKITIPAGIKYIRVSHYTASDAPSNYWFVVTYGKQDELARLQNTVTEKVVPVWESGYIDSSTRKWIEDNSVHTSDFIPVRSGQHILLRAAALSTYYMLMGFSEKANTSIVLDFSNNYIGIGSNVVLHAIIPDGVNYIKTSHPSAQTGVTGTDHNVYIVGEIDDVKHSIPVATSINNQWMRYRKTSPKKPVIAFEMDMNSYSFTNAVSYIELLEKYGVKGSTFYVFPTLGWTSAVDFQDTLRNIHRRGHEIALHSLPDDGTGENSGATQATESEFRAFIKTYFDWFYQFGYYPTGWVTTQGKLYDGLLPLVKDYMNYAHTQPNGMWDTDDPTEFVNQRNGDRYTFVRYNAEMSASGTSAQEETLINQLKAGVDEAIRTNGMFIIYCHSFNESRNDYTMRDSTLRNILSYIKPYIDNYRVVTGNIQDLVEYFYD